MLTRALIMMFVVLNLGVTAWWMWRPESVPNANDIVEPSGIAQLQLLQEHKDLARPASGAATPAAVQTLPAAQPATVTQDATPLTSVAPRCYRFGPFTDDAALATAHNALQALVTQLREQSAPPQRGRGWRVVMPPSADRIAANALAERIKLAGFQDLFIIGEGTDANAIALGRFSTEERAQAHAAQLRSAGFAAQAEPLGGSKPPERWLLATVAANFDAAAARRASKATQADETACVTMR